MRAKSEENGKKTLIVVESPTKAKSIGAMLPDCVVIASQGHIRDLPQDEMGIDLETLTPKYIIPQEKKAIVKELKKHLENADKLVLATDEDREGESIARHIIDVLNPTVPTERMVFHEITKKAILEAFSSTRDINKDMVNAQEARRVLDRLFGYSISPLLWSKLSVSKLSAGRVQSPTLRLIVERELERMAYKTSSYDVLKVMLSKGGSKEFITVLDGIDGKAVVTGKEFYDEVTGTLKTDAPYVVLDSQASENIKAKLYGAKFVVEDVKTRESIKLAPAPFITSTLQQEANTKLHYTTRDTMRIAQNLYEKGFITYMRTDSPSLSEDGVRAARMSVQDEFGGDYLLDEARNFTTKDKNAQEAHEAIRPAIYEGRFLSPNETKLRDREKTLYTLIYRRTIATQMKPSVKLSTVATIDVTFSDNTKGHLRAKGVKIQYLGFLKAYDKDDEDENTLPTLNVGDELTHVKTEIQSQETQPISRYTEASLIKKMEDIGIGRPSTYATTVSSLISKQYVARVEKTGGLAPTFLGVLLSEFLSKYFEKYIMYDFTANMEKSLDDIANHEVDSSTYLNEFFKGDNGLETLVAKEKKEIKPSEAKRFTLPTVDSKYEMHYGKFGPYIECEKGDYRGFPKDWLPSDVTNEKLEALVNDKRTASEKLDEKFAFVGNSKTTGEAIYYAAEGKHGPYWILGNIKETKNVRFCSVPRDTKAEDWSTDEIDLLFALPRVIGKFEETGEDIIVGLGRYGLYVAHGRTFVSLKNPKDVFTITEKEALALFKSKAKK